MLAALPLIVDVDIEVVPFEDGEAVGVKELVAVLDFDFGAVALGVFGAAG